MYKILILTVFHLVTLLSAQNNLLLPDTLNGEIVNLTLQHGTYQFYPGLDSKTMGVNGDILGPTLIFNKGNYVDIFVKNQLEDTTTIHWHGMHVSAENDGGPHTTIAPGEIWNPHFTVLDKAGTYWYHPHLHQKTNEHVSKGIAGFIIVRDEEEAGLNLPRRYGIDDFPLAIQTKTFDNDMEIVVPSNSDSVLLVNATINAVLNVPAQVVRFRLLDGSSQRVFNIGLSDNKSFYQIGSDGGLLSNSNELTRLQISPGERAEILIDFSSLEGQTVYLKSYASEFSNGIYGATNPGMGQGMSMTGYNPNPLNGNDFTIVQFNVGSQTDNAITEIPSSLALVNPLLEASADTTRDFILTATTHGQNALNGEFLINDAYFEMNIINEVIPLNNVEVWSITNQSPIAHPFHIHDVQFYILDRNGSAPNLSEQGKKDVVLIKPMETVRFITEFKDFANDSVPYMYHCHMLTHEDQGMMGQFVVIDESVLSITDDQISVYQFELFQAYPNPFNPETNIEFELKNPGLVSLAVYNVLGQKVATLLNESMNSGVHAIKFRADNFPSGIYYYALISNGQQTVRKMMLVK
ncbi:MAG: T9SS C-terminal target domain-containing protein [Calditrichaeota bacterium]|nr:MAG: T9SS C-terminal target domain-containing protein [Calditrichota bacterium]MBL1207177.1 T9SS C-terminal target domain-containing protein [Calditrichota bacterium]NOG47010.1 multicopper oxidase domain-containing protein [Calditrichota bacterium]